MSKQLHLTDRLRWWQSLVGRAVLLAGIALALVIAVIAGQDYERTRRIVSGAVMTQMTLVTQAKADEMTRWIEAQRDVLTVVAGSRTAQRWAESVTEAEVPLDADEVDPSDTELGPAEGSYEDLVHLLLTVTREHAGIREVAVLRAPDGQVVASSDATRVGEVHRAEVAYLQGLQGPYASKAQTSPATGRTLMTVSAPLRTPAGTVAGVMTMELDLDWVQRTMLARAGLAPGWERYLVDRSLRLVVGPGAGPGQRPALWSDAVNLLRSGGQRQGGNVGAAIYRNYRGEQVIGVYRWIEAMDLALLIEANLAQTVGAQSSEMLMRSSLAGILLVGLVIGGAFLLGRQVARPLGRLSERMRAVAVGEFELLQREPAESIAATAEIQELAGAFHDMVGHLGERYAALEARVAARTDALRQRSLQLQAAADVSSAVAAIRDAQELLNETVRLIPTYFDFDHVGIFLKDDRGAAVVLRAASSEGGQRMLARGHRLLLGQGIVGTVAKEGTPRIALDVSEDAVDRPAFFFDNPDLPHTRSEMALPLIVRGQRQPANAGSGPGREPGASALSRDAGRSLEGSDARVLGVLDVQSERPGAFTDEDVIVFQSVADQIALAIENARLLEESDRMLHELQMRYGEQIIAAWKRPLIQMDSAYRYTGMGWVTSVDADSEDGETVTLLSEPLKAGLYAGQDGERELLAPIVVRGETLGSITLRQDAEDEPWDEEALALANAICIHIGEALESARLLDEAQVRAAYEQLTGDIAERVRSSAVDIDEVLQTTLRELGTALGATGTIRVQPIARQRSEGAEAGPRGAMR